MRTVSELLGSLERSFVLEALVRLDAGAHTAFAESTKYDLVYMGKRYAPKRVAGLALQIMSGGAFGPKSFTGGEESSCFRALRRCGFTVVLKSEDPNRPLKASFEELLSLQTKYSSANTPEMQRRGVLVRQEVPDSIRSKVELLEPIFSSAGYSLNVEGSDGVGLKVESAWVRLFDQQMSPSATQGWYIVLHFSRSGNTFYLTLGCAATRLKAGSLIAIHPSDLAHQVEWARKIAEGQGFPLMDFCDSIELNGNDLSRQFERATALAKRYSIENFTDWDLWNDLQKLCRLLIQLYENERLGKSPVSDAPEAESIEAALEIAVSPRRIGGRGQGRGLTLPERLAVEERAMVAAKQRLLIEGFTDISDVHKSNSYDYSARRADTNWIVEVKGTTSSKGELFYITAAELKLHNANRGNTVLVIVSDIHIDNTESGISASGGVVELFVPWSMDEWEFEPTTYRAQRLATGAT